MQEKQEMPSPKTSKNIMSPNLSQLHETQVQNHQTDQEKHELFQLLCEISPCKILVQAVQDVKEELIKSNL
jgi:hypothetical protein